MIYIVHLCKIWRFVCLAGTSSMYNYDLWIFNLLHSWLFSNLISSTPFMKLEIKQTRFTMKINKISKDTFRTILTSMSYHLLYPMFKKHVVQARIKLKMDLHKNLLMYNNRQFDQVLHYNIHEFETWINNGLWTTISVMPNTLQKLFEH